MWKSNNINNYPLNVTKLAANPEARLTRAVVRGDLEVL